MTQNESGPSLVISTSSPVKQQQTLLVAASPSKPQGLVSPFLVQCGSLLKNESVEHLETETSIQKSISKLELLEKSAFSSAFSSKIDKSTVKSLDFSKSPKFDNLFEKKQHIPTLNFVEDSVAEGKAANVNLSTGRISFFSMDQATSVNDLEPLGRIISGKSPYESSSKNIVADQLKSGAVAASPSKITWSAKRLIRSLFTPEHNEDSILTETESLWREIAGGNLTSREEVVGATVHYSTPAKENTSQVMHSKNLDVGNLTSRGLSSFEDNIPRAESRMVSHDHVSPSTNRNLDQQTLQKVSFSLFFTYMQCFASCIHANQCHKY